MARTTRTSTEPVEPVEPTEPVEPVEPVEPTEPVERIEVGELPLARHERYQRTRPDGTVVTIERNIDTGERRVVD